MPPTKLQQFGEWLKLRRLAGELTPLDMARYLEIDIADYRRIEGGELGVTEAMLQRLAKLEKLRVTMRDLQSRAVLTSDGPAEVKPAAPVVAKKPSPLDAIIAAAQQRQVPTAAPAASAPTTPLAALLAKVREERGLTSMDMARACKVTPDLFQDIDGGFIPGAAMLRKLADGLQIDLSTLETTPAPQT